MADPILRKNIFLADENVHGDAVRLARIWGVDVLRVVDLDIPCNSRDFDQCIFDYAVQHGYIVVTVNIKHFEPKFYQYAQGGEDHPGLVLINPDHRNDYYYIAEWLALLADENVTNT